MCNSAKIEFFFTVTCGLHFVPAACKVQFGVEKFHHYAYGWPIVVECNHKPLEAISRKHLSSALFSIARMMLLIHRYAMHFLALLRFRSCCSDVVLRVRYISLREVLHLKVSQRYIFISSAQCHKPQMARDDI